jgi:hypothetical protein
LKKSTKWFGYIFRVVLNEKNTWNEGRFVFHCKKLLLKTGERGKRVVRASLEHAGA